MSQKLVPLPSSSQPQTVTNVAANAATGLQAGKFYQYVANTDTWIAQGTVASTPVASIAGAGCMFVPARVSVLLCGSNGAVVSTIQDTTNGKSSVTKVDTL